MPYTLPSINDLFETYTFEEEAYTLTHEQASKILKHTGAIREAETELYKALHHFNSLSLQEQLALDEWEFHDYWVVYLSKGIVTIEPMYEAHHGLAHAITYKCFDRSDTVILQTCTSL